VISPSIAIEGVDEGGFGHVVELLSKRDLAAASEVQVLHEGGVVFAMLHTIHGNLPAPFPSAADPVALAAALRVEHGVDRAVVVDADSLGAMREIEVRLSGTDTSQPELMRQLTAAFWGSAGVVADPPPLICRWGDLSERLLALGDGDILLRTRDDSGALVVHLLAQLARGWLTRIGTLPADYAGHPVLDLELTEVELAEILSAPDVAAALLARPELRENA
jgi:hypothetical protein